MCIYIIICIYIYTHHQYIISHTFTCLYIPLHPQIITPKSAVVGAAAFVRLVPPPLFRCLWMRLPMSKSLHAQLMYAYMHASKSMQSIFSLYLWN